MKGELKSFLEKRLFEVQEYHPEIEIEKFNIQVVHVHLVSVMPPRYSVSSVVGKMKATASPRIRMEFPWIKKVYWDNEFWCGSDECPD